MRTGASPGRLGRRSPDADATLLDAVRSGDVEAFAELWRRHVAASSRLAQRIVLESDVDDVVSEAFTKMLRALQQGGGPARDVGSYLTTAVYRVALEIERRRNVDAALRPPERIDPWIMTEHRLTLTAALAQLPLRWRQMLWHAEVEGAKPRELAVELGLQANAVSALRHRARTGLRDAWLAAHIGPSTEPACAWTRSRLVRFVDGALTPRVTQRLAAHLRACSGCADARAEVDAVRRALESDRAASV